MVDMAKVRRDANVFLGYPRFGLRLGLALACLRRRDDNRRGSYRHSNTVVLFTIFYRSHPYRDRECGGKYDYTPPPCIVTEQSESYSSRSHNLRPRAKGMLADTALLQAVKVSDSIVRQPTTHAFHNC